MRPAEVEDGLPANAAVSGDGELADVRRMRDAALKNGYRLVRVRTGGKAPVSPSWQHGEAAASLLGVTDDAANTGMLCGGLRVVDVDVDDPKLVGEITRAACALLPKGSIIRRRAGSPRYAMVFRAEGEPGKLSASGTTGKVEILGSGQQLVIDGVHPSGARLNWMGARSPATVSAGALPVISEAQVERFLSACSGILGATRVTSGNLAPRLDQNGLVKRVVEDELSAGIDRRHWFDDLTAPLKRELVEACLSAIDNRRSDSREQWLAVLFAVADAESRRCPDARELALGWSRRGAGWSSESDFDKAWDSFRVGGTTIGTLIYVAQQAGADLTQWQNRKAQNAGSPFEIAVSPQPIGSPASVKAIPGGAVTVADLPALPPKRKWLHGTDTARGAVSLLVAPGARGKSTWLLTLALACASGRPILGSHIFGGPLRVLYLNAEDATSEIALRLRAAMRHHGLNDADIPGLRLAGVDRLRLTLLEADRGQPRLNVAGWNNLISEIDRASPDLIIIDPLVALVGGVSLNDNSAAALLLGNFVRLAAERQLGFMLAHHASKNRETSSADAAMGAASLVNLARICFSLEPLSERDAIKVGVAPWDARSIFRIVGTKQNLSPPDATDRWFRLVSVELPNAEPPIYPKGDRIGVVECFVPNTSVAVFPPAVINAALAAISSANPPLSPTGRAAGTSAMRAIAAAIAPHRGGNATDVEAKAVIDYLIRSGSVAITSVKVPRPGRGPYTRNGLVVAGSSAPSGAVTSQPPP
jgi:hypothetical protein